MPKSRETGVKKRRKITVLNFRTSDELAHLGLEALKRAAKTARKVAKMHGTPIVYMRNGKIIEEYL